MRLLPRWPGQLVAAVRAWPLEVKVFAVALALLCGGLSWERPSLGPIVLGLLLLGGLIWTRRAGNYVRKR